MMKRLFASVVVLSLATGLFAQSKDEAFKDLMDGRWQKAQQAYEALVAKNAADETAQYWLGQTFLVQGQKAKAREQYAKALEATKQNPLIMVGMGHVELLEGKAADAKSRFEAAIAATANRKNKKHGDPAILNAIVRANADGPSNVGDVDYAVAKATACEEIEGGPTPDMFTNLGIAYLKKGGEFGGQAKRAFEKALDINPNYAPALFRIGRIFKSQRNDELMLQYYQKAITANSAFGPAYLEMYDYYSKRDVNRAGELIDEYIKNSDQNRETEFFRADFLFRAGKYQESLNKGKEIEAGLNGEKYPKIYKLYALNYDRLKDSVSAMKNMERFINESDPEALTGDDYSLMAIQYLKVPGNVAKAETMAEKGIAMDTVVESRMNIMRDLANAYAAQENWKGQYKWLDRMMALRADTTARNYFFLADAAHKAGEYDAAQRISSMYIKSYPEQSQGYYLKWRAAVAADPDTSMGTAIAAVDEYNEFLMKDVERNKNRIIGNYGYKIYYYLLKSQEYQKALEAANGLLAVDPTNDYGLRAKAAAEQQIKARGGSGASQQQKPAASSGQAGGGGS
ncbi:MAG TPA: tetratricopeptide repeat protein [Phnomibacter sp.]|nr:tetratricopeptide repeat protein [Phnomibacter sp.]